MSLVSEPTARKISPIFYVVAVLCFLLPFAGVSCNTSAAKSALGPLLSSGGGAQADAANKCIDALANYNFVTYSGVNLAFNTNPTVKSNSDAPADCQSLNSGSSSSSTSNPFGDSDQAKLGIQPFALGALILVLASLILGALKLPMRGVIVAATSVVAIVLLLLQQSKSKDLLTQKITESAASQGGSSGLPAGMDIGSFFQVNLAYGALLCIAVLAIGALYNLASQFLGGGSSLAPAGAYATPGGYDGGAPPAAPPPMSPPSSAPPPSAPPPV
jgi:hypothetical protein